MLSSCLQTAAFSCVLRWKRETELCSLQHLIRALIPSWWPLSLPPINIITSQGPHLQIPSYWGLEHGHMNVKEDPNIQSITTWDITVLVRRPTPPTTTSAPKEVLVPQFLPSPSSTPKLPSAPGTCFLCLLNGQSLWKSRWLKTPLVRVDLALNILAALVS